jgi:transposase InsO family protein
MKGSIGCPTRIVTVFPNQRTVGKLREVDLSKEAKRRLEIIDWYFLKSPYKSLSGKADAKLTCRHFGIHRSQFYRWLKRYNPKNIKSLEKTSTAPKKKREPEYSRALVKVVREIREADPTYSAEKIRPILLRTMPKNEVPSVATLGRLITRNNLFFRADVKRHKKRSNSAKKAHRQRKPYGLKPEDGKRLIEFDMKHVQLLGSKHYAFCAIDVSLKEAVIHVASSPSSRNGKIAMEKAVMRWGKDISFVNDNGSENMDKAEAYLLEEKITQYWTRPKQPKDKPFVERFIGTLQRECLDYNREPMNVSELRELVDVWLEKYHHYRPHASLGGMTPAEFSATLGLSIPKVAVSYM